MEPTANGSRSPSNRKVNTFRVYVLLEEETSPLRDTANLQAIQGAHARVSGDMIGGESRG